MVPLLQQIYIYARISGSVGAALGTIYGGYKYLASSYKQRESIYSTVNLLATNHLPHIQASLDSHGESLKSLSSELKVVSIQVEAVEQRLDDTKQGVHTLGEAFLRHLEKSSKEV